MGTEKSQARRHCQRCRAHRGGPVSSRPLPQDGSAVLHRQEQGQARTRRPQEDYLLHGHRRVNKEDNGALNKLVDTVKVNYNERADEIKKHWGGSSRGAKSTARINKVDKAKAKEAA